MHCLDDAPTTDLRFADDEFTQAADAERRAHVAHAHALHAVLAFFGAVLMLGAFRRAARHCG